MSANPTMGRHPNSLFEKVAPIPAAATVAMPAPSRVAPLLSLPLREAEGSPTRALGNRTTRWLQFELAGQSYAIELLKVQEVQGVPDIVPVRGSASDLLGVINLHGHIVPVLDLARRLGFTACDPSAATARIIVLEEDGTTMGLLVSAVTEVARLDENCIEYAAAALPAFPNNALIGIARRTNMLLSLLDGTAFLK
jgi:purine-binding chemotaxis protein CheW